MLALAKQLCYRTNTMNDSLSEQLRKLETQTTPEPAPPLVPASVRMIREARERYIREIELLERMAGVIDKVPEAIAAKCCVYCSQIDFNSLTREESIAVMLALGAGQWEKSVNACSPDTIDYTGEVDGVTVRLWAAAPPDSCRVIEVTEELPATKITRRKLICSDSHELKSDA